VALVLVATVASAWQGKVVHLADGDTVTVLRDSGTGSLDQLRIRLHGIDAPESGQDFGDRAKSELSTMVAGKVVEVQVKDRDKYGRFVALLRVDGLDVNREMVVRGMAWVYRQYCTEQPMCGEWESLEATAKAQGVGLWSQPHPVPPWEYRHPGSSAAKLPDHNLIGAADTEVYHGNVQSRIFHRPGCRYYDCKACTATFTSRDAALTAGYSPCKVCKP
jgi:endonuclease YncB( thermonuclease family)